MFTNKRTLFYFASRLQLMKIKIKTSKTFFRLYIYIEQAPFVKLCISTNLRMNFNKYTNEQKLIQPLPLYKLNTSLKMSVIIKIETGN